MQLHIFYATGHRVAATKTRFNDAGGRIKLGTGFFLGSPTGEACFRIRHDRLFALKMDNTAAVYLLMRRTC